MRFRAAAVIMIALALAFGAYFLIAHVVPKQPRYQGLRDAALLTARLQLTPNQQQRIEQINTDFGQRREELRLQHCEHRRELTILLRQTPSDRQRIAAKLDQAAEVQREMQQLAVNHILDVSAELDEEQRERLFALIDEAMCPGPALGRGRGCR